MVPGSVPLIMLEDALRYPWQGENHVETILIGGVLTLLGVLLVPLLFVCGYLVRVIRLVSAGADDLPPVFEDWWDLLVEGFVAFAIGLAYLLVPATVVALAVVSFVVPVSVVEGPTSVAGPTDPSTGGAVLTLLVVLVVLGLIVGAVYLLPAAIAAYAVTGRAGAAFSPSTLWAVGGDGSYAVALLIAVLIGVVAQLVAGVVTATVIGALLIPLVTFYGNVASAYAIGTGVRDTALRGDDRDDAVAS
ncbi:DUF4013 domain-containing protein [Haloarcula montana]|uniref:DUF4013 domain-containing protein n=1 Tax=Haloarcula montana TaxID=3111776 RepID=UPI002D7963F6|nr:DUF4013 domain-containing protein [Haloarcula sp. GH36]